ncbi:multiple monosaccharide ABC transporter substrate-binding protein [Streptomyces sp. NPDC059679]|uniref:multiple monosaccharide ABC transporter substrate-binding protein n=1 Tax=Streptomyces sp. NPDC059679 TaxID=3346903 RepID=UPI00368FA3FB
MRKARAVRALAALAALLTLSLTATACGQEAVGGSRYKGGNSNTIGIAMPVKTSERWIADGKNMVKQFQAAGYKTDLQYGEDDVRTQVAQLENMVTKQYKLLVIAPIDGTALTDVLQSAHDANIPVISYDRLILGSKYVDYYATFDNFKVGVLQASYLVKKLGLTEGKKGPFNIELFAGSSDDNNTRYFFNGAMSVLKPYLADGRLVVRSGQTKLNQLYTAKWSGKDAQDRMENLLNKAYSNADVNAVLSPYDGMSMGILSALQGVGYGTKSKPYPFVSGQDAELPSIKSIIRGEQTQTVYKDTRKLAKATVQMATAKLNGGKPQVNDTKSYNNGKKVVPAYLLNPVSIDKSNTQLLVKEGYYTAGQLK